MRNSSQSDTVQKAFSAIDRGDTLHGLITLECSPERRAIPAVNSYLAYCIAKERGQVRAAVQLCQVALSAEPRNPAHYLNLGRIYLLAGQKPKALATFQQGLSRDPAVDVGVPAGSPYMGQGRQRAMIMDELRRLGIRKRAPFSSLDRTHPLNRIAGKLLTTIHMR